MSLGDTSALAVVAAGGRLASSEESEVSPFPPSEASVGFSPDDGAADMTAISSDSMAFRVLGWRIVI